MARIYSLLRELDGSFESGVLPETITMEPLDLRVPLNRDAFLAQAGEAGGEDRNTFRVAGLMVHESPGGVRVVVSHHYWYEDEQCVVLRFSEALAPAGETISNVWRTLHETSPCLPIKDEGHPFAGHQSGGRIAALGDTALIVTVGDHEFDGLNSSIALPQLLGNDYGKTLSYL